MPMELLVAFGMGNRINFISSGMELKWKGAISWTSFIIVISNGVDDVIFVPGMVLKCTFSHLNAIECIIMEYDILHLKWRRLIL